MVQLCLALCDPMVGSPRSGCQHGWVLVRALFLPYRPLPSCPVLTWPFFRESAQGQRRETETQLSEDAFFARPQGIRILVLQPGIELGLYAEWKCRVLTTEPPGNSLLYVFNTRLGVGSRILEIMLCSNSRFITVSLVKFLNLFYTLKTGITWLL